MRVNTPTPTPTAIPITVELFVVCGADIDGFEDIGNGDVVGLEIVVVMVVNVANEA